MKSLAVFILVLLLFYYGAKLFVRYILPWLITKFFEKQMDNFNRQQGGYEENIREGEVRMSSKPHGATKTDDKSFGEYIDFEEIKDNEKSESDE